MVYEGDATAAQDFINRSGIDLNGRKPKDRQMVRIRIAKDKSTSTTIEYGLIAAGISLAIITATTWIGPTLINLVARAVS